MLVHILLLVDESRIFVISSAAVWLTWKMKKSEKVEALPFGVSRDQSWWHPTSQSDHFSLPTSLQHYPDSYCRDILWAFVSWCYSCEGRPRPQRRKYKWWPTPSAIRYLLQHPKMTRGLILYRKKPMLLKQLCSGRMGMERGRIPNRMGYTMCNIDDWLSSHRSQRELQGSNERSSVKPL